MDRINLYFITIPVPQTSACQVDLIDNYNTIHNDRKNSNFEFVSVDKYEIQKYFYSMNRNTMGVDSL